MAKDEDTKKDIPMELTELERLKLENLSLKSGSIENSIRAELSQKYSAMLQNELKQRLAQNAPYVKSRREYVDYLNSLLDQLEEKVPEGYAVVEVSESLGSVKAKYLPEQRGQRLKS